jgi:hypothetical protein
MKLRRGMLVVLVLLAGARYLATRSPVSGTDSSSITVPTVPSYMRSLSAVDSATATFPKVGQCIAKQKGRHKYKVAPCARPNDGKVLKQLQGSDVSYSNPLGWNCPAATDSILTMSVSSGAFSNEKNYCVDTKGLPPAVRPYPNVGDCVAKKAGHKTYDTVPCSQPNAGKVLKRLSDGEAILLPNLPDADLKFFHCPPEADAILEISDDPSDFLARSAAFCIDTKS